MKIEKNQSIVVEVTQDDINKGVCGDPNKCAIARAVRRTVKRMDIDVNGEYIKIEKDDYEMPLNKKAVKFIEDFDDNRRSVKPFSFVLKKYKRQS